MNEFIRLTVAGTPRHDNCVRLPVSWKPINNCILAYSRTVPTLGRCYRLSDHDM